MGTEGILLLTPADLAETPFLPCSPPLSPHLPLGDPKIIHMHAALKKAQLHPQYRQHVACSVFLLSALATF